MPLIKNKNVPAVVAQPRSTEPLHVAWRPKSLDEVIGHEHVIETLGRLYGGKQAVPHTVLLTGPSGTGKTTLARILCAMLKAQITEVDAVLHSSMDAMRSLVDNAQYAPLGAALNKAFIIDESHRLSKHAWDVLLKSCEEPPKHLFFFFCTTEAEKVPQTIKTRAHRFDLGLVPWDVIGDYMCRVTVEEGLGTSDDVIALAARASNGSVRQALVYLSQLAGITQLEKAQQVIAAVEEDEKGPVELARLLFARNGANFMKAKDLIQQYADQGLRAETIRLVVVNYAVKVAMGAKNEGEAGTALAVMQAFSTPCFDSENMAPILLSLGSLLLQGN